MESCHVPGGVGARNNWWLAVMTGTIRNKPINKADRSIKGRLYKNKVPNKV